MPKPFVTEEEQKTRLEFYRQGLSDKEISRRLNLSISAIWYWRRTLGLPANFEYHPPTKKEKPKIESTNYCDKLPPRGRMPDSLRAKLGFFELGE
jgi:transposase